MIKIVSRYSHAAGSTLALVNLCNEFNSEGFSCRFYGPDNWHLDKCKSGNLDEFSPEADDSIIVNDIPLLSVDDLSNLKGLIDNNGKRQLLKILGVFVRKLLPTKQPRSYRLYLTCLNEGGMSLSSVRLSLFQKIHFSSSLLKRYSRTSHSKFIAPSIGNELKQSSHKPVNIAGVIGSIKRQNNIEKVLEQALRDGMGTVIIFGYMADPIYYFEKIEPLTIKYSGRIKYAGFVDNKQQMYDAVSDVYCEAEKSWSLVRQECAMTNTRFHAPESASAGAAMTNGQIFELWKKELSL